MGRALVGNPSLSVRLKLVKRRHSLVVCGLRPVLPQQARVC